MPDASPSLARRGGWTGGRHRRGVTVTRAAVVAILVAAGAHVVRAQYPYEGWGWRRFPPRFATPDMFDGTFNFCRILYDSARREPGGTGWRTDYPNADVNFTTRLAELTKTPVSRGAEGEPNHVVVRLTDDALFQCPFVIIEDAGTARFSDVEADRLHAYLLKGGFMWVDDFWGSRAWQSWRGELAQVLPPVDYPIVDVRPDHPIFRALYTIPALPQIPSIQFWRQSGGETSERGSESRTPQMRAIADADGRIMVLMTHNTDIADAWEREGEDPDFFYSFSPQGYAVGINVLLYAMSH